MRNEIGLTKFLLIQLAVTAGIETAECTTIIVNVIAIIAALSRTNDSITTTKGQTLKAIIVGSLVAVIAALSFINVAVATAIQNTIHTAIIGFLFAIIAGLEAANHPITTVVALPVATVPVIGIALITGFETHVPRG